MTDRIVMIITIVALLGLSAWLGQLWQNEVIEFSEYRGKAEQAAADAEQRAKDREAHWEGVVKDVNRERDATLPRVREDAVANYIRRFGGAARLCPGTAVGLQPQPTLPGPGALAAEDAGLHVREEPQQLAPGEAAFVRACADDAQARNLTRETLLRMGFEPEGTQ